MSRKNEKINAESVELGEFCFTIYAGKSLTDSEVQPIILFLNHTAYCGIEQKDSSAWAILLYIIEAESE